LRLHRSNHFLGSIEGTERTSSLEIFLGFGQAGIDNPALLGIILVVSVREFGTVDRKRRREHDLAAMESGFHQIAFRKACLRAQTRWQSHLALAMNFNESGHLLNAA
jgi:hypothetical protein